MLCVCTLHGARAWSAHHIGVSSRVASVPPIMREAEARRPRHRLFLSRLWYAPARLVTRVL
eukprot:4035951-Prymnesium_polylepis.1